MLENFSYIISYLLSLIISGLVYFYENILKMNEVVSLIR